MRKLLFTLLLLVSFTAFAENKVSISTKNGNVYADIDINPEEHIILKEQFLSLYVISDHYDFTFSGYPDGELQESGDIYYSNNLRLEGVLSLKEGVEPDEYQVEVVLGFQTCDKQGITNIPVKVYQNITVSKPSSISLSFIIALCLILVCTSLLIILRRKRR